MAQSKSYPKIKSVDQIDIENFIFKLYFTDGTSQTINFSLAVYQLRGENSKYRDYQLFCDYKIKDGELVWGSKEEALFNIWHLYNNSL